ADNKKREETSRKISELFSQYSNWMVNPESGRILRKKLIASLLPFISEQGEDRIDKIKSIVMRQILPLEREIEKTENVLVR
ncbi:MAG: hypothetical protein ACP5TE_11200, partial [Verrucomicrobiia bacterium]